MSIVLFESGKPDDGSRQARGEPSYSYLNRSGRPEPTRIRTLLEEWFSRLPDDCKADVKGRFLSGDAGFIRAFFELYLHALLTRLGYEVETHPMLEGETTHPDYLVSSGGEARFYLEAIAPARADADVGTQTRIEQVYASLDGIESPNFFIAIRSVSGTPVNAPSTKTLRRRLSRWLGELDPDAVAAEYEESQVLPSLGWTLDGDWEILIEAIPKKPEGRGKEGVRPVGAVMGQAEFVQTADRLRSAVQQKAGKYGTLDLPFVIAVNLVDPMDHIGSDDWIDLQNALLGDEHNTDTVMSDGRVRSWSGRNPNGVWWGPEGARRSQVSSLLLASQLGPWSIASVAPVLVHHPGAVHPLPTGSLPLPEAQLNLEKPWEEVEVSPAPAGAALFGLPNGWPRG